MHIFHVSSYYDGPVEGLLLWKNHIYYFVWIDEDLQAGIRVFALARLEPHQYFMLRERDTRTLLQRLPTFISYGLKEEYTQECTIPEIELQEAGFYVL